MTREELSQVVELLRDTAKLHQPNEEILTDVKAESFIFIMDSVLSVLSENKGEWIYTDGQHVCSKCNLYNGIESDFCPNCGADMRGGEV